MAPAAPSASRAGHQVTVTGQHAEASPAGRPSSRPYPGPPSRASASPRPPPGRLGDAAHGRPGHALPGAGRDVVDDQRHRRLPGQFLEVSDRALLARAQVVRHYDQRRPDLRPLRQAAQSVGAGAGVVAAGPGDQRRGPFPADPAADIEDLPALGARSRVGASAVVPSATIPVAPSSRIRWASDSSAPGSRSPASVKGVISGTKRPAGLGARDHAPMLPGQIMQVQFRFLHIHIS